KVSKPKVLTDEGFPCKPPFFKRADNIRPYIFNFSLSTFNLKRIPQSPSVPAPFNKGAFLQKKRADNIRPYINSMEPSEHNRHRRRIPQSFLIAGD
ncbi:MAG: hypothetical protein IJA70_01385, partial [Oscillospiraceae bacterium]|nr:hypothetical protein [Oscillospiraceae bacterium]